MTPQPMIKAALSPNFKKNDMQITVFRLIGLHERALLLRAANERDVPGFAGKRGNSAYRPKKASSLELACYGYKRENSRKSRVISNYG